MDEQLKGSIYEALGEPGEKSETSVTDVRREEVGAVRREA
jgi:hypothetical protein